MTKILLIFTVAIVGMGGYVPTKAITDISGDRIFKDDSPNTFKWIEIEYKDGTKECIDDGDPCTHYYHEDENGYLVYERTFC